MELYKPETKSYWLPANEGDVFKYPPRLTAQWGVAGRGGKDSGKMFERQTQEILQCVSWTSHDALYCGSAYCGKILSI